MSTINLSQITLDDALNDPDSLIVGATCRSCGLAFFDTNGKRLCDSCLVGRVNGAGELEDDDPEDAINQVPPWASGGATGLWAIVRGYWREEIRAERPSPALARLERICAARGYDYQATVWALS